MSAANEPETPPSEGADAQGAQDAKSPVENPPRGRAWLWASGIFAAALIAFAARASIADREVKNPKTPDDGIVCQILADGARKPVRCAVVLDAPPDRVTALIRDYRGYPQLFGGRGWHMDVDRADVEGDGRVHFVGRVRTRVASWPIDLRITHEDKGTTHENRWDETTPEGISRGHWRVEPTEGGRTLLAYQLDLDAGRTPGFLTREFLFVELRSPLRRIRRRVSGS